MRMTAPRWMEIALAGLLAAATFGQGAATAAAASPASATSTTRPGQDVSAAARRSLENLERTGTKYATLRAKLVYRLDMPRVGDSETRTGWVAFRSETARTSARFRIHFETLRQGAGRTIRAPVDYAFDGQWLTIARHRIKEMTRYQLALPGHKVHPLKLGKSPLPLPFGQKASNLLAQFEVAARPAIQGEPPGTEYLELTTPPAHRKKVNFARLQLWTDPNTRLPVRVVSTGWNGNVTTVQFKDYQTDIALDKDIFHIPLPAGWTLKEEKLRPNQPPRP